MKSKTIFLTAVIATSIIMQFIFILYFFKISHLHKFVYIKEKIKKLAFLSYKLVGGYDNFTLNKKTLILQLPSINTSNTIISDSFDYAVVLNKDNVLIFSSYPSPGSYRKHKSRYIKDTLI